MISQISFRYQMLVTILLLVAISRMVGAVDWCGLACGSAHTMCKFPTDTPASKCGGKGKQVLTKKQIEDLLDVHNRYRDYVAAGKETRTQGGTMPTAANMGMMTWNEELQEVATRWARQCDFSHDQCRAIPSMSAGQNIAMFGSSAAGPINLTELAFNWYIKEVNLFSVSNIAPFVSEGGAGHFTQYIWAESYQLGCGYVGFQDGGFETYHLVCNYGPAGNMMGMNQPLYLQGKPCSRCPKSTKCGGDSRYPNLCSTGEPGVPKDLSSKSEGSFNSPPHPGDHANKAAAQLMLNSIAGMLVMLILAGVTALNHLPM